MSFLSRIVDGGERRVLTNSNAIPRNSDGFGSDAGEFVNERTALQLGAVYACTRLLADSVASLPMDAYRRRGSIREELSPMPSLVRQPSTNWNNFEWVFQVVTSLALRGNSINVITKRDVLEYPTEVEPLHPDQVRIDFDERSGRITYDVGGTRIPNHDILHIRRFVLPGCPIGLSPIQQARMGIGLSIAAERFGARWFGQAATPSSVLETDQNLTEEAAKHLQKQWISSHGGKRHPAVLSGGVKWRPIEVTPDESQFLQTRQFQRGEIAMMFGVPPHMIGDTAKSTSWGSGIEQQSIGFVTYTLRPWLSCIETALSSLLPRGQFVRFNVDGLLRGDQKARYDSYTAARNAGWMSVNEIRSYEDMPPIPDGDTYIQPLNMAPLGTDPTESAPTEPDEPEPDTEEDPDDES